MLSSGSDGGGGGEERTTAVFLDEKGSSRNGQVALRINANAALYYYSMK